MSEKKILKKLKIYKLKQKNINYSFFKKNFYQKLYRAQNSLKEKNYEKNIVIERLL